MKGVRVVEGDEADAGQLEKRLLATLRSDLP
jgi:hypothetical protein